MDGMNASRRVLLETVPVEVEGDHSESDFIVVLAEITTETQERLDADPFAYY